MTPNHVTAKLIQAYAALALEEYGEDETPAAILKAALETETDDETCAIGRAILCRHQSLADSSYYRFDRKMYHEHLTAIAQRLGWEA